MSRSAITPTGPRSPATASYGLVTSETQGTVSVIDLASGEVVKHDPGRAHLSHPEGIAIDPKRARAFVAIANEDQIGVIDTKTLSGRTDALALPPQGHGTTPTQVSGDQRRLRSALRRLRRGRRRGRSRFSRGTCDATRVTRPPRARWRPSSSWAGFRWAPIRPSSTAPLRGRQACLDIRSRAGRGTESERPEPELPQRQRRLHKQLPVPALDRPRQLGHPRSSRAILGSEA